MQSLETESSRPIPKFFETETRPETFETETETPKNGSRDTSRDRDLVSRLHHCWNQRIVIKCSLSHPVGHKPFTCSQATSSHVCAVSTQRKNTFQSTKLETNSTGWAKDG